jgi:hypothetical protein
MGVTHLSNLPNLKPSSQMNSVQAHGPSKLSSREIWALRRKGERRAQGGSGRAAGMRATAATERVFRWSRPGKLEARQASNAPGDDDDDDARDWVLSRLTSNCRDERGSSNSG